MRRATRPRRAADSGSAAAAATPRLRIWWYGGLMLAGFGFGLFAERRPFGDGFFAHPLVVLFLLIGAGLLALRVATARPVPEVLPDRMLLVGCLGALAAFLIGNFVGARLIGPV
jgi:predicted cobalt transporter CbtA